MTHDHDDDSLHAGCAGCIKAAEEEAWRVAPLREVTWTFTYWARGKGRMMNTTLNVRVPEGATKWAVDERYMSETGEAFVMALPEDVPMECTTEAMESMEVDAIKIGPVVSEADTGSEQGALL